MYENKDPAVVLKEFLAYLQQHTHKNNNNNNNNNNKTKAPVLKMNVSPRQRQIPLPIPGIFELMVIKNYLCECRHRTAFTSEPPTSHDAAPLIERFKVVVGKGSAKFQQKNPSSPCKTTMCRILRTTFDFFTFSRSAEVVVGK